jgi:oligopeptide/dipeptide ABC transporter ATP-binding protein
VSELVHVEGLAKRFDSTHPWMRFRAKSTGYAVERIGLTFGEGEFVALVGESGSGKTTLGRCLLGLVPFEAEVARVCGFDVRNLRKDQERAFRLKAQMIFQNPYASLDPAFRVRASLVEALQVHDPGMNAARAHQEVERLAEMVQLPPERLLDYPPSLSGGEKRRVVFARAMATRPRFIVTDEPLSGLDQPIQAQLVELLKKIHERQNSTFLFISHDLRLSRTLATRVIVMLRGRIVEDAPADRFFGRGPKHPYSQELLESAFAPELSPLRIPHRKPPSRGEGGCQFRHRCALAAVEEASPCVTMAPELLEMGPGHRVACHWCRKDS